MVRPQFLLLALIAVLVVPAAATAEQFLEDFEYEAPGGNTFSNGVFQHSMVPIPGSSAVHWGSR